MAKQPFREGRPTNMRQKRGFFGSYTDDSPPKGPAIIPAIPPDYRNFGFFNGSGMSYHPSAGVEGYGVAIPPMAMALARDPGMQMYLRYLNEGLIDDGNI